MASVADLKRAASTTSVHQFCRMLRYIPGRPNIVAEGDSWFDYPRRFVLSGKPANVVDWIQRKTRRRANLLRLASNGAEAVEMLAGDQRFELCKILELGVDLGNPVDVVLYSGGGNDVAGRYRLDRILKSDASGAETAADCFLKQKLRDRMKQIELGYLDLIDVCARYSPSTVIVTHTYDYPFPDGREATFLKAIRRGPWLLPFLEDAKVPTRLLRPAVAHLIDTFAEMMHGLAKKHPERLVVTETRNTLRQRALWKDELHSKSEGFEKIAKKVYASLRDLHPSLRAWE